MCCGWNDGFVVFLGDLTATHRSPDQYLNPTDGKIYDEVGGHWSVDPISDPKAFSHADHRGASTGKSVDPLANATLFRHPGHQQPYRGPVDPISNPDLFRNAQHQQGLDSGGFVPQGATPTDQGDNQTDQSPGSGPIVLPLKPDLRRDPLPNPNGISPSGGEVVMPSNGIKVASGSVDPISNPEKFAHPEHHPERVGQPPTSNFGLGLSEDLPNPGDYFDELGRLPDSQPEHLAGSQPLQETNEAQNSMPDFRREPIAIPEGDEANTLLGEGGVVNQNAKAAEIENIFRELEHVFTQPNAFDQALTELKIEILRNAAAQSSPFVTTSGNCAKSIR